jgi:hypothetical protein
VELLKGALAWLAPCLACAIAWPAQAQPATEHAIKAAFLYKFAGYVEWPAPGPQPGEPFVIGTMAADEVTSELARMLPGRSIGGRPVVVRVVREGESLAGISVLFIGRREPNPRPVIRAAQQHGVLTVMETGLEAGAAISFVTTENRVGFEVSLDAVERAGHRISSRMLAVARRVVSKGGL